MSSFEENNNQESQGVKSETTPGENENEESLKGIVERTALYILRNQNWICVLMLTPISLIYDLYCFCKYTSSRNMTFESNTHIRIKAAMHLNEFYYI